MAIKVASLTFKAKHGEGGWPAELTDDGFEAMNDSTTYHRELKT